MTKDILTLAGRYHAALNNFDFAAIEKMFTEDAEYHSTGIGAGVGGLYGRSAIMEAMKAYFAEFSDQVSADDSVEAMGLDTVRAHWRLHATTKSSGRKVHRQGVETIHFNPKGLITLVEVQDVEPCAD
jgi:ketosteroid isomerase-like protein